MFSCAVCGCKQSRMDWVDEVFRVDGEYVLVERIPAEVCSRCGEKSCSLQTAEAVRQAVNGGAVPERLMEMRVFRFAAAEMPGLAAPGSAHSGGD